MFAGGASRQSYADHYQMERVYHLHDEFFLINRLSITSFFLIAMAIEIIAIAVISFD